MSCDVALENKVALITGGTRGIGARISERLAASGATVLANYLQDDASAQRTRERITRAGGRCELIKANLASPEAIREVISEVNRRGRLDVLIHNAALGSFKPASKVRANQWDLTMNVNARALLLLVQGLLPLMRSGSRIISVSSLGSNRFIPDYGAIGVSKAALEALTRYLAAELAPEGILVNGVSAGLVQTDSVKNHPRYAEIESEALKRSPLGRIANPDDVANVVLFLSGPLSDYVCGQVIVTDGGASLPI